MVNLMEVICGSVNEIYGNGGYWGKVEGEFDEEVLRCRREEEFWDGYEKLMVEVWDEG